MMDFTIIEAKRHHCGTMGRIIRRQQQESVATIGLSTHHELKVLFEQSTFRRSAMLGDSLTAMWGVTGSALSTHGLVWAAISNALAKHPFLVIREARAQIAEMMETRHLLLASILDDDAASRRMAIFLGFVPASNNSILPAISRAGRREMERHIQEADDIVVRAGIGAAKMLAYSREAA